MGVMPVTVNEKSHLRQPCRWLNICPKTNGLGSHAQWHQLLQTADRRIVSLLSIAELVVGSI